MEFPQTFRRDSPEQDPSEKQSRKRVSACDSRVVDGDLEGLDGKKRDMLKILDQINEKASSVLDLSFKWEEIDKEFDLLKERAIQVELKEKSVKERILELEKKEERLTEVQEREREIGLLEKSLTVRLEEKETESDVRLSVMRLLLEKKVEAVMDDLKERDKKVMWLSKSNDDNSCELQRIMKEFDLKQIVSSEKRKKEAEQLEAREKELCSLDEAIKEKWTEVEKKAEEMELKSKFLELKEEQLEEREKDLEMKQIEFEERSLQAKTCTKLLVEKGSEADSHVRPRMSDGDEYKETGSACVVLASASSPVDKGEAHGGEIDDFVSRDGTDDDPEPLLCADSEFNDFSKTMSSFVVGKVWALYDQVDTMPRLYGRIKRVNKSRSSLQMTWVEPKEEGSVPVACGRFKYGITETTSHLMLSHEMHPVLRGRNLIAVNPRKGETWALFRDWSKSWNNNPEQHKPPYRYDFVEVLLNFDELQGVGVSYLGKVEGFLSVFKHAGKDGVFSFMIPPEEMHRLSHRIPSFRMNGDEKEGVPTGSFELDPAAIPTSILKPNRLIHEEEPKETERRSEDCAKAGEVEDQDGLGREIPIVMLD